jgi:ZIP family zinc transporter
MEANVSFALLLTLLAGCATAIGGGIAWLIGKPKNWLLALILGFSAGVMIYISFMELLPLAIAQAGPLIGGIAFFVGIIFIAILDIVVPHEYQEEHGALAHEALVERQQFRHRIRRRFQRGRPQTRQSAMFHMGILTALGIAIHNLPEGLAVFSSAVAGNIQLGILVAIAVALHNIPEGIIVFIPIHEATGKKKMAFLASAASGLAEPLGALIGWVILAPFLSPAVLASLLAFAAGIMVYISLDELLPASREYGSAHLTMVGIGFGMFVMALSFILMLPR